MVSIIFTKSKYPLSWLICSVTKEPVSHCAILVDNTFVVHSAGLGVKIEHINHFSKMSSVLYRVDSDVPKDKAYELLGKHANATYDWKALLFIGMCLLARKIAPKWVPKQNLWQVSGMFICTEFVTEFMGTGADSLVTPYQLYKRMEN